MVLAEILLPGSLLLAKFLLKLFVDRNATLPDVIAAVLSLPVDIAFLAASLFAAKVIAGTGDVKTDLTAFVACLVGSVVIIAAWRRSDSLFTQDKFIKTTVLATANYIISTFALIASLGTFATRELT